MPRYYRVPYTGTLTNAGGDSDLCSIQPADDKPCRIIGWTLGQSSETGDSAEESLRITLRHMTSTVTIGSGGSSVTPVANRPGTADYAAAGFTARCNDTTVSTTSGSSTIMEEYGWNVRATPWEHMVDDRFLPIAMQTEVLILRCESTPADDITIELTVFVEEC
jgi:hypothetical protein